ncbi:MAG: MarR family transcriptional regulator [Oscillospiraceae bacterium]|nr:MarR family transcriptional regulator [Oscillospiraceae bacterium]
MMKTYGGFLMSRIRHLSGRVGETLLKECGVEVFNGAQGRILYVLWEHGSMTITRLGQLTSLAKTTLTSMLDRMEAGGLARRIPDRENRRQIFIEATEKAHEYREKYDWISDRMSEIFYRGFSDDEITAFENQLRKIIQNLENEGA